MLMMCSIQIPEKMKSIGKAEKYYAYDATCQTAHVCQPHMSMSSSSSSSLRCSSYANGKRAIACATCARVACRYIVHPNQRRRSVYQHVSGIFNTLPHMYTLNACVAIFGSRRRRRCEMQSALASICWASTCCFLLRARLRKTVGNFPRAILEKCIMDVYYLMLLFGIRQRLCVLMCGCPRWRDYALTKLCTLSTRFRAI